MLSITWLRRHGPSRGTLALLVAFVVARLIVLGAAGPIWFSDTDIYAGQYQDGFAGGFWGRARSWGYPFFLWLTGYYYGLAALVQRLIAALAWFALARAAADLFPPGVLRRCVLGAILLLSFTLFAIQWEPMLLSESLTLSLFLGMTALWIRGLAGGELGRGRLIALGALAVAFAGLRDSNIPLLLLLAGLIILWIVMRIFDKPEARPPARRWGWELLAPALLVLCALVHHHDTQASHRSWANVANVLSRLIFARMIDPQHYLTVPEHIDWMARHYRMPREEPAARAGKTIGQPPPLSPQYEAWLKEHGARAWAGFLRHHPGWVWTTYRAQTQYAAFPMSYLAVENEKWRPSLIGWASVLQIGFYILTGWFFTLTTLNALLAIGALLLGAGWIAAWFAGADRMACARLGALAWLVAVSSAAALVAIVGDTIETWRHAIVGLIALYVAIPLAVATVLHPVIARAAVVVRGRREAGTLAQPTRKPAAATTSRRKAHIKNRRA